MEFTPSRAQGHLIVAAIRVLQHLRMRPPTPEEISEHLNLSREVVLHILRGLEGRRAVRFLQSPFEVRVDIVDHEVLDALPLDATGPDMGREIQDFHKKTEDRQKQIEKMMREADPEERTREKTSKMEEEFRRFKNRKSRPPFEEDRD
jgi:DNA-directed RNA polymerase specialized sigma subunit